MSECMHDYVIKWNHFPRHWPSVLGINRSPVNSPHTGQWRRTLMFSLIYAWINGWVNNREAGDLRRHRNHYQVIVMIYYATKCVSGRFWLEIVLICKFVMVYVIELFPITMYQNQWITNPPQLLAPFAGISQNFIEIYWQNIYCSQAEISKTKWFWECKKQQRTWWWFILHRIFRHPYQNGW